MTSKLHTLTIGATLLAIGLTLVRGRRKARIKRPVFRR
jgi:hypothetical protein